MQAHAHAVAGQLRQYTQTGVHSGVAGASPHRLILMLLDGAMARIATARGNLERREVAAKGSNIAMASAIVESLRASLNLRDGGDLAARLDALYEYVLRRLLAANLDNDANALAEVHALLEEIRAAWVGIEAEAG